MTNATFPPPSAPWPAPSPDRVRTRWQPPQWSAAGWLATIGAVLLLAASTIVVAGNWQSIDPAVRFAGLVAALVAVYAAAEAGRRRIPSTSRALATLAASLTAPVGVAAAATLQQPWPVCTLVGGVTALVATEVQARRWDVPALRALTLVAFGLAAVGASALTAIPVTVIAALGAAVALAVGATRRAVALALAVGISPLLTSLAEIGIGTGTLPRIGADGAGLTWSALLSCTISAIVIGVVAHRLDNAPLALGAIATFSAGLLTALVAGEAGAEVWLTVPAMVLLALEAAAAATTDSVWRQIARRSSPMLAIGIGVVAFTLPYLALLLRSDWGSPLESRFLVPLTLTALALVAAGCGSARRAGDPRWPAVALTAASAAAFALLVAADLPLWTASVWPFVVLAALGMVTPRSILDLPTAACASWVTAAFLVDNDMSSNARIALVIAAGLAVVASTATTERHDHGCRLIFASCAIGGAVGLISTDTIGAWALVSIGLIAIGVTLRPRQSTWPLAVVAAITYGTVSDQVGDWPAAAIVALAAVAFAGSTRDSQSGRLQVSAVLAVISAALTLVALGTEPDVAAVAGSVVAIALSGIALVDRRFSAALAGGTAAASLAVLASISASPVFASIAVGVLGLQLAVTGATRRGLVGALPGGAVAMVGLASCWWTTGTNAWVIDRIEPYGVTGVDVAVAGIVVLLLGTGAVISRRRPISSWLAYGPALALVTAWLLASQLEPGSDWATLGGVAIGVGAIAVGGQRRLGAPLVSGTMMVVGTLLVSAGPRLATAPTWAWIAVGGAGLLTLAAWIERSERPTDSTSGPEGPSRRERFCEEFR